MWWNNNIESQEKEIDEVVEVEEMEDFAKLEDVKKDALKWVESQPDL